MADLKELLEPYRGKRGLLKKDLGIDGIRMLYSHPEVCGSPKAYCEFIGFSPASVPNVSKEFTLLGLPISRRDWAANEKHVTGQMLETMTDAECLDAYLQETNTVEYADVYEWHIPRGEESGTCVCMGDLHICAEDCDVARIVKTRDWILANETSRWALLGDAFNLNTKNSKGGLDPVSLVKGQKIIRAIFKPIASRCIAWIEGNHDQRPANETGVPVSVCKELCAEMHIPYHYTASSVFQRLRLVQGKHTQEYDGMLHHGFGGARTPGGKRKYLFDMIANLDVDFFFMGHVHDRDIAEKLMMGLSAETEMIDGKEKCEVEVRERTMGIVGSFQKWLPNSYARVKGMNPAALGSISAQFNVLRHTIHGRK